MDGQISLFEGQKPKTRYEFVKTLSPEQFLAYMWSEASSVCERNGKGERRKTHCLGKYREDCKGCYREFWLEENIAEGELNDERRSHSNIKKPT